MLNTDKTKNIMAGRILVLDDEENYAEMLQDLLRENGYRVDMATRPERALAQLEEIPYDLVISDYKMPVMDGADLLKKSRELYPGLPFILVSGLLNTPELVKVANMSVTLVMEKPLDTQAFLDQVARFSAPLSDEEREQLAREGQVGSGPAAASKLPNEPRFYSAHNPLASRFLQTVWTIAEKKNELYILEPRGGDAELVLKDVSGWLGNDDRPMAEFALPDTTKGGLSQVGEALADGDTSGVIIFRLDSPAQITQAREISRAFEHETETIDSRTLLAFIISGGPESAADFEKLAGRQGAIAPEMRMRPSDVAAYARRFARIATDRAEQKLSAEFTTEAGLALLTYDWPENYRQIREVVQGAVQGSGDAPIDLKALQTALGEAITLPASAPLSNLLKAQQVRFLRQHVKAYGLDFAGLSEALELDPPLQSADELEGLSLQLAGAGKF